MKDINIQEIVETVAEWCCDSEGSFNKEIKLDNNIIVSISGEYSIEQYQDNDYFNGTGGWVVTNATVDIDSIEFYDIEGNELNIPISIMKLEDKIEDELKRIH